MLGAPAESRDQFKAWSHDILGFQGTGRPSVEPVERAQASLLAMRAFLSDLASERRRAPREDLIGNGLWLLLTHPEHLRLLRERPELMPSAIEEMLRMERPRQRNPRQLAVDVALRGRRMRAGDYVMQVLDAANHDAEQFPAPHRCAVARSSNRHVAFGHGIHSCLGAPLVRLEAPIAIGEVLRRMPDLALAERDAAPRWHRLGLPRGLDAVRVTC